MTGIQALERAHKTLPMKPGRVELQEFEYIRHGTQSLIANWHVALGKVITPSIASTRTEADFAAHITQTIDTDPEAGWIFIVDQLNIHQSESLVVEVVSYFCRDALFVYHSSNVKIGVLRFGSYVTPDAEISKTFGRSKPGKIHYCHEFEAEVRDYSIVNIGGRTIIDVTAKPVGQLERSPTPTGEDWENYVTTSELRPISIIEY